MKASSEVEIQGAAEDLRMVEGLLGQARDIGLHDGCRGDGRASALRGEVPGGEAGFRGQRVQVLSGH